MLTYSIQVFQINYVARKLSGVQQCKEYDMHCGAYTFDGDRNYFISIQRVFDQEKVHLSSALQVKNFQRRFH